MSQLSDIRERIHLARSNVDLIALAVGQAVARGAVSSNIVVILLDTRDPVGHQLMAAILERTGSLDLGAEEARVLKRDMIPTGIAVVPARVAELLLAETHPLVSGSLSATPPTGRVRVVAIAAGGAALMHLPLPPSAPIGVG